MGASVPGRGRSASSPRDGLARVFFVLLAAFPLGFAAVAGAACFLGVPDWGHYGISPLGSRSLAAAAIGVATVAAVMAASRGEGRIEACARWVPPAVACISLAGLVVRVAFIALAGSRLWPFSDFLWAYEAATGVDPHASHYAVFPSWGFYAMCLQCLFAVAPASPVSVQMANAAIQSLTIVVVYLVALRATAKPKVAIIACAVYAACPTGIFYCALLTPEIPAALLDSLSLLALSAALPDGSPRRAPAFAAVSGALLGVAELLKPISPIVLIAFAVTLALFAGRGAAGVARGRALACCALSLVLASGCFVCAKAACVRAVEGHFGVPVASSSAPAFLFIGLAHDGEGQIHLGEHNHWHLEVYKEHADDLDYANQLILERALSEAHDYASGLPSLLAAKAVWAWQDDVTVFSYMRTRALGSGAVVLAGSIAQAFYIVTMALAAAGAAMSARGRPSAALFLISCTVFGFALLLLVGEAQSRYKVMVMPYVHVLTAIGLSGIAAFARSALRSVRLGRLGVFPLRQK